MIKINFSQIYSPFEKQKTEISVSGTTLTYNGQAFDLSEIPDGASVDHEVIQKCTRNGDDYELTLTVWFCGELPENYGKIASVEITGDWVFEYEHTKGALNYDLAE